MHRLITLAEPKETKSSRVSSFNTSRATWLAIKESKFVSKLITHTSTSNSNCQAKPRTKNIWLQLHWPGTLPAIFRNAVAGRVSSIGQSGNFSPLAKELNWAWQPMQWMVSCQGKGQAGIKKKATAVGACAFAKTSDFRHERHWLDPKHPQTERNAQQKPQQKWPSATTKSTESTISPWETRTFLLAVGHCHRHLAGCKKGCTKGT